MRVELLRDMNVLITKGTTYVAEKDATGMYKITVQSTILVPASYVQLDEITAAGVVLSEDKLYDFTVKTWGANPKTLTLRGWRLIGRTGYRFTSIRIIKGDSGGRWSGSHREFDLDRVLSVVEHVG